jgi:hypothetical protein
VLTNPAEQSTQQQMKEVQEAANALGLQSKIVTANTAGELEVALASRPSHSN